MNILTKPGSKSKATETSRLTFMGVMIGLTIVFVFATLIPNPAAANIAVVMFLPTILAATILGPKAGAIIGLTAGLASMIRAAIMPMSLLDPFFINPLVSVMPRICVGLAAGIVFVLCSRVLKINNIISSAIAAACAMLTNTMLVIGMLYLINGQRIVEILGAGFIAALGAIFLSNGLIEVITATIIIPILYKAYNKYTKVK